MGKQVRSAFCPVCGVAHGQRKKTKARGGTGYYLPSETESYWDWLQEHYPEGSPHFGIIQETGGGRGKAFGVIGYFTPAEDQDGYFPAVKARVIMALRTWLARGWITQDDLNSILTLIPRRKPLPKRSKASPTSI